MNKATPTATATPTPTPTETGSAPSFPATGILDTFNRSNNNNIGSNWAGSKSGYKITSNKLDVVSETDVDIYWNASQFGASQEAYVTLATVDPNATEMDLLLKGQGTSWSSGVLAVVVAPTAGKVMVWTYEASQGWQQRGADIVVSFGSGDVLGARGYADGTVAVYKNGNLIGTVDVSAWPYYSYGGRIGLETINGDQGYYDDFGGGTLPTSYSPGGSKGLGNSSAVALEFASFAAKLQLASDGDLFTHNRAPAQRTKARSRPAGVYKLLLLTRSQGEVWRSYYYAGGSRIALREDSDRGTEVYYILTDHLGSTALTYRTSDGAVSRQWYKPWGEPRSGTGQLPTGRTFTGQREHTALDMLWYNSRFYDPQLGRFPQADTLIPNPGDPLAWDRFAYTRNNPVRYTDPTGRITQGEAQDAEKILKQLAAYGVSIAVDWGLKNKKWQAGLWTIAELQVVLNSVEDLANAMGGTDQFKANIGEVQISQKDIKKGGTGKAHNVTLSSKGFSKWTVVHELAHAWDGANRWKLSREMQEDLRAGFKNPILHFFFRDDPDYWYDPGEGPPPCGTDSNFNTKEDFAETVTAYVYPTDAQTKASASNYPYDDPSRGYSYSNFQDTPRGQYIKALIVTP